MPNPLGHGASCLLSGVHCRLQKLRIDGPPPGPAFQLARATCPVLCHSWQSRRRHNHHGHGLHRHAPAPAAAPPTTAPIPSQHTSEAGVCWRCRCCWRCCWCCRHGSAVVVDGVVGGGGGGGGGGCRGGRHGCGCRCGWAQQGTICLLSARVWHGMGRWWLRGAEPHGNQVGSGWRSGFWAAQARRQHHQCCSHCLS